MLFKIKYPRLGMQSKKVLMQKYQTLRLNISPHLIIASLWVKEKGLKDKGKRIS